MRTLISTTSSEPGLGRVLGSPRGRVPLSERHLPCGREGGGALAACSPLRSAAVPPLPRLRGPGVRRAHPSHFILPLKLTNNSRRGTPASILSLASLCDLFQIAGVRFTVWPVETGSPVSWKSRPTPPACSKPHTLVIPRPVHGAGGRRQDRNLRGETVWLRNSGFPNEIRGAVRERTSE